MTVTKTSSLRKKVFLSTSSQLFSQVIIALLGVITLKISTNYLGVEQYGVYATVLAFVSMFALLTDLGLNAINSREIAKRPQDAEDIISHNIGLRLALCVIMVPLIFGLSFIFYPHASTELRYGILLLSGFLFFDAVRAVGLSYFGAQVRGHVSAIINSINQILVTSLVILTVICDLGYFGIIGAFIVANTITMTMTVVLVRRELAVRPRINIAKWRAILAMSISLGAIQLINMLYLKVDSLMLSVLQGTTAVGIYGIAYSLIASFMMLPSFLMTALVPSIATSTPKDVRAIVQKAYGYMAIFAVLLAVGAFAVKDDIIPIVSGKEYAAASLPFALLAVGSAFGYLNSVFGFASVSLSKHHRIVYVSLGALVVNILLNLVLIPRYSFNGAAVATLMTELISLLCIYFVFKSQTRIYISVIQPMLKPLVAGMITLLGVLSIREVTTITNPSLGLIVSSTATLVIYVVVLYVCKGLPAEFIDMSKLISKRLHRRTT